MDARIPRIADSAMLFAAIALGTALAPALPYVGLPIAAAGIAGLAYRGNTALAAGAAATGVAVTGMLYVSEVAYAAPVLAAVLLAVVLLPRMSYQVVGAGLVGVLAIARVAANELIARQQGSTFAAQLAQQSNVLVTAVTDAMGTSSTPEVLAALKQWTQLVTSTWPASVFTEALVLGVIVVAAIAWAARKADRPLTVPPFSRLDLTPHVLWAFVAGLLLSAASYASFAGADTLGVVGLNLVLCARSLFFLQGISVAAGVLDRAGVGLGGRILALAALAALDAFTLAVSFSGLLDFWVNFRRLPRDGVEQVPAEPDGRQS